MPTEPFCWALRLGFLFYLVIYFYFLSMHAFGGLPKDLPTDSTSQGFPCFSHHNVGTRTNVSNWGATHIQTTAGACFLLRAPPSSAANSCTSIPHVLPSSWMLSFCVSLENSYTSFKSHSSGSTLSQPYPQNSVLLTPCIRVRGQWEAPALSQGSQAVVLH